MKRVITIRRQFFLAVAATILLAGCGGGGSTSGVATNSPQTTTIQGVVAKGLVKGGTVKVYSLPPTGDISQRQQLVPETTTSSSNGTYSVNIGTFTGLALLEATGSYLDETDGVQKALSVPLRAAVVIGSGGGTVSVAITPFTEMAVRTALTVNNQVGTILTGSAATDANALLSDLFPFNILSDLPVEPLNTIMNAATQPQRDYTLALAAISRQAASPGSLNTAIERYRVDLASLGRLSPVTVSDFQTALTSFLGSARNQTGTVSPTAGLLQVGYYSTILKLNLSGLFASGTLVKGLNLTLNMPAGVSIRTDSLGSPLSGIIIPSGVAAQNAILEQSLYHSSGNYVIIALLSGYGFGSGEFATFRLLTAPNVIPTVNDFTVTGLSVFTQNGLDITSASTVTVALPN